MNLENISNSELRVLIEEWIKGETNRAILKRRLIDGKNAADVWDVIEEVFEAVHKIAPRLYEAAIQKLDEI